MSDAPNHWQSVYLEKDPTEVSWYEPVPAASLGLIEEADLSRDRPLLDVGGGASKLAGELLKRGHTDVTVANISGSALSRAQAALGTRAEAVEWVEADVRSHDFARQYDLWHDRAVFHFMVMAEDQEAYLATLQRTLKPGGHVVTATFGPDGPHGGHAERLRRPGAAKLDQVAIRGYCGKYNGRWGSGRHALAAIQGECRSGLLSEQRRRLRLSARGG